MLIRICTAKIHRATVTKADLDYVGSVTIDKLLLEKSGIKERQMVDINNLSNGVFWQTYVMPGGRGGGTICLNGPPARHFQPGDKVIILGEAYVEPCDSEKHDLVVVLIEEPKEKRRKKNQDFKVQINGKTTETWVNGKLK